MVALSLSVGCSGKTSGADAASTGGDASTGETTTQTSNGAVNGTSGSATTTAGAGGGSTSVAATSGASTTGSVDGTTGVGGTSAGTTGSGGATTASAATGSDSGAAGSSGAGTDPCPACPPCVEPERRYSCDRFCACELVDSPARDQRDQLLACGWEEPCDPAGLLRVPNGRSTTWTGAECLFAALHDRTPSRLDLTTEENAGFVQVWEDIVLLLDGSDEVAVLGTGGSGVPTVRSSNTRISTTGQLCTLKPPSFYDACYNDPYSCAIVSDLFDCPFEVLETDVISQSIQGYECPAE